MKRGLRGPKVVECVEGGCRLLKKRDDECRPGTCYARLAPSATWDRELVPDVAGRDV